MKIVRYVIFSFIIIACNPTKQLVKEAELLEKDGRHEEATNHYYSALLKKSNDKIAKEGLKKSAQPVLNDKFTQFSKYVLENKIEDAIKQYKNAEKYVKNAENVGVKLDWPTEYNEVYIDVRDEYVLTLYDEALHLLKDKKFDAAEKQFQLMAEYDSSYKDATILRLNTILEPLYQRGISQLAKSQFKDAYNTFDRILEIDDQYKDAEKQKNIAKESATISLAVFPVLNKTNLLGDEVQLNSLISEKLAQNNNPYVRISEADEFHKNMESRGFSNISDAQKAAEAGRNFGFKYILISQLLIDEENVTPFNKVVRDAYEAFTESILNPITGTYNYITKFKKAKYDDTFEARKLKFKVAYQFISSVDGRVLFSDEIEVEKSDEQHLLTYTGNINNLYQELPQGNYLPPPNETWRDQFTQVKRKLLSKDDLSKEISIQIAEIISSEILPRLK